MQYGKYAAIAATGLLGLGALHAEETNGRSLVMETIDAHGGSEKWYGNGQLQFRWTYHMTDKGADVVVDTVQTVDPKSLAVKHEVVGKDITFGFNNGVDWIRPKGTELTPPHRFWALTPTYFLGIPFVFNDENANFETLPESMEFEGKEYTQVKITYNKEAGDSPDDYYVLLIDPETKVTRGAYYTVTSDLLGRDQPGPPKFISLDDLQDVGGVMLAEGHRTFEMPEGKIGEQMRFTEVSGVKWLPEGTVDLAVPE
ncbi:MAG: hypothetical protein ACSHX9_17410 [Luteolibacter sp.]